MGSKVPFCQDWKITKMALLNIFKKKSSEILILKCYEHTFCQSLVNQILSQKCILKVEFVYVLSALRWALSLAENQKIKKS